MKLKSFSLYTYDFALLTKQRRYCLLIQLTDEQGNNSWGEIAPLPKWSAETLEDALEQIKQKRTKILSIDWTRCNCLKEIKRLHLLPSVAFGLEAALLALLDPLPPFKMATAALLMGSFEEILNQAKIRQAEGHTLAKLKVGNLSLDEAAALIYRLRENFRLRIDVNGAWETSAALKFFASFPLDAFDYVEEPFQNPKDLKHFCHPLAVDESFPHALSLKELASLTSLKALIYKPTIQGGMLGCLGLQEWALENNIDIVLSSSFESDLGIAHIASMAQRLSLLAPLGIGTYHYLASFLCHTPLSFSHSLAHIPQALMPSKEICLKRVG